MTRLDTKSPRFRAVLKSVRDRFESFRSAELHAALLIVTADAMIRGHNAPAVIGSPFDLPMRLECNVCSAQCNMTTGDKIWWLTGKLTSGRCRPKVPNE